MAHKMVIVVRKDLNMRKGKIAAQAYHGAVSVVMKALANKGLQNQYLINNDGRVSVPESNEDIAKWFEGDYRKICCYVNSEEEILELCSKADELDITYSLIKDNGLTEFHGELTTTCVVFEPLEDEKINTITGNLSLL